jgi:O-antigen/teichoic acid export membrane protein
MSEKDEALKHLSEIKSALIDKDSFFPYNYNALIVWGIIGIVMTIFIASIYKSSVMWGSLFSLVMMSIGFIIEGFMTKRVNEDYDIEDCTKRQKFIMVMFTVLSIFAIAFSALLAQNHLIILIYVLWIFLIGFGDLAVGFVLNIEIFKLVSYLNMSVAILLLIVSYFIKDLDNLTSTYHSFVQGVTFALLGIIPILVGRKLKGEVKSV